MKYYIAAPAWFYSGGPEALHQLEHALRAHGFETVIMYYGLTDVQVQKDFAQRYGSIQAGEGTQVDPDGVLILPEIESPARWRDKGWQRIAIWWLAARRIYPLQEYDGCAHLFQSHYAQSTLAKSGFFGEMLTDYIRDDVVAKSTELRHHWDGRGPQIAINHRTAGVVSAWRAEGCDLKFTVIEGLSALDALDEMARYRIFLDLGWHPGRDRMPREAALAGCVVLVNTAGSAGEDRDMPLPSLFRLGNLSKEELQARIREIIEGDQPEGMTAYREWVEGQKSVFMNEAAKVGKLLADPQFYQISHRPTLEDLDDIYLVKEAALEVTRWQLSALGRQWFRLEEPTKMRIFALKAKHWLVGKLMSALSGLQSGK